MSIFWFPWTLFTVNVNVKGDGKVLIKDIAQPVVNGVGEHVFIKILTYILTGICRRQQNHTVKNS